MKETCRGGKPHHNSLCVRARSVGVRGGSLLNHHNKNITRATSQRSNRKKSHLPIQEQGKRNYHKRYTLRGNKVSSKEHRPPKEGDLSLQKKEAQKKAGFQREPKRSPQGGALRENRASRFIPKPKQVKNDRFRRH